MSVDELENTERVTVDNLIRAAQRFPVLMLLLAESQTLMPEFDEIFVDGVDAFGRAYTR